MEIRFQWEELTKRTSQKGYKCPRQVRGPWQASLAEGGESSRPRKGAHFEMGLRGDTQQGSKSSLWPAVWVAVHIRGDA